ncbi:MAG: hypothetical protein HRU09_04555 [Oligoflexales bacterium]|nr:hypothetical protein [Oligoflexales bacterium]
MCTLILGGTTLSQVIDDSIDPTTNSIIPQAFPEQAPGRIRALDELNQQGEKPDVEAISEQADSQSESLALPKKKVSLGPQLFFDADQSTFDKDGMTHRFEGNVIAIAARIIIAADRLVFDKKNNQVLGEGHVVVIAPSQVISGTSLVLETTSNEFTMSDAMILVNDSQTLQKYNQQILGFTSQELSFETERSKRLTEISKEKSIIRDAFRDQAKTKPDASMVERYVALLEKEELIRKQTNSSLAKMPAAKRESFQRRRDFWQRSRGIATGKQPSIMRIGYFVIEGESIKRLTEERFYAKRAFFTPCFCQADETPPWGFRAEEIHAKGGAYADFYHPILEIKGVPVLYLPFLKIPMKSTRQSGFLLPSLTHSNVNGSMYSQPIFFALNENSDATLTADFIQNRGQRLGLEYRIQSRQYSGWEFQFEAIRDRLWLNQKEKRHQLADDFKLGLDSARNQGERITDEDDSRFQSLADPGWWMDRGLSACLADQTYEQCMEHEIDNRLRLPNNSWRGQFKWKGQSIIAPRLNLISHGSLLSDHRYQEDLWVPSFSEITQKAPIDLYASSRTKLHLDGENFYLGVGSHFSDPVLALEKFSGYQVPMIFKLQTRMISLFGSVSPLPLYLQTSIEQRRIEVFTESIFDGTFARNDAQQRLGNGSWQRLALKLNSPLVTEQIINADYFSDFEYRSTQIGRLHRIHHNLAPGAEELFPESRIGDSYLHSIVSGIHLGLPLDGRFSTASRKDLPLDHPENTSNVVEHRMNWDVTFSLRSYAARRGKYGATSEYIQFNDQSNTWNEVSGATLSYYPSDQSIYPSQLVTFSTSHDWVTYEQGWNLLPGSKKQGANLSPTSGDESSFERYDRLRKQAEQELIYSLDRPILGVSDLFNNDGSFAANRYQLTSRDYQTPLHVDAKISFDYLKVEQREEQKKINRENNTNSSLPEPWTPLNSKAILRYQNWSLNSDSDYNLYKKLFTKLNFRLSPPSFFQSGVGFSYNISNAPVRDGNGFTAVSTRTRGISFSTGLIPHFSFGLSYGIQQKDGVADQTKAASFSTVYSSPTRCWGLKTGWTKQFTDENWNEGTYYVGLVVNFFQHSRTFGNMASKFNQP